MVQSKHPQKDPLSLRFNYDSSIARGVGQKLSLSLKMQPHESGTTPTLDCGRIGLGAHEDLEKLSLIIMESDF